MSSLATTSSSSSRRESRKGSHKVNDENSHPNHPSPFSDNQEQHSPVLDPALLSMFAHSIPLNKVHRLDLDIRHPNLPPMTHITGLPHVLNLKILSLTGHFISDLEGLSCLQHLVELNLSENSFRKLDNLDKHLSKSLVRLNLSGNKIQRIPDTMSTLTRLSVLRLARNDLEVVTDLQHLKALYRLRHLRLEDNPFSAFEKTIPYALFCVPSMDTINGCEIMPNERRDAFQRFQHLESNDNHVPAVDTTTSTSYTENTTGILSPIGQPSMPWGHHDNHAETAFHLRMAMDGNESSSMDGPPVRLGHLSAYAATAAADTRCSLPDAMACHPISTTGMSMDRTAAASSGQTATVEPEERAVNSTPCTPFTPDSISHYPNRKNNNSSNEEDADDSCRSLDFLDTPTVYPPIAIHNDRMDSPVNSSVVIVSSPYSAAVATATAGGIPETISSSLEILDLHDRIEQLTTRLLSSETAREELEHTHHQLQQDLSISQSNEQQLEEIILALQSKVDESDERAEQVLQRLLTENQELVGQIQCFQRQGHDEYAEVYAQLQHWQRRCGIAEGELKTIREEIGLLEGLEETTTTTAKATTTSSSTITTTNGLPDDDHLCHRPSRADAVAGISGGDEAPCLRCSGCCEGMQNPVVLQAQTMAALAASERRVEGLKKALSLVSLVQVPPARVSQNKGVSLMDIDEGGDSEEEEKEKGDGMFQVGGMSPLAGTVATLQRDIVELERDKQRHTDTIAALHATLGNLQRQRVSLSDENDLLNQQATALAVDVARLEDQRDVALARMPELLAQAALAEVQGTALVQRRVEREGLDAAVASMTTERGVLVREKGALERQLGDLRGEIVALGGERQAVEEAARAQQEVLMRLVGEEQTFLGAVAAAEEAAGVALAKAEQARSDQGALAVLHEAERHSLAATRDQVLRVKSELLSVEDRLRRTTDAAAGEEEKLRLLSSLVIGQANAMDDTLQAVKREVEKQEQLTRNLAEQRRKTEEDMFSQQRRLEHQCQVLRNDIDAKENRSQVLQRDLRRVQGEMDELLSRRQSVTDERLRADEKSRAELSLVQVQEAVKEKQEVLRLVGRDLLEMEETLRLWRDEKESLDHDLRECNERLEGVQREDNDTRMALSMRQKEAEEDLKQTLHRTQLSATALKELTKQLEKRQGELSQSRSLLRQVEAKRDEVAASTLVQGSALETLHDELRRARYELELAQSSLQQLHEQIATSVTKHASMQSDLVNETKQRDTLRDEINRLRHEVEDLRRCEENMKHSVAVLAAHVEASQKEMHRLRQEIEKENITLTDKRSQTVIVEGELSCMAGEHDALREKHEKLRMEQDNALRAAIACLKNEQSVAETNKALAVRQLEETSTESHRAMVEHTNTLAALDRQITHQRAILTQTERALEAVCKSRREEETRLSHQQLMCRAASEELVTLEEQMKKLRMETPTTVRIPSQSRNRTTATATAGAIATIATSNLGDVLVRAVSTNSEGGRDLSTNQQSSSTLSGDITINTTVVAAADIAPSLLTSANITGKDTNRTVDPTPTSTQPPLPPPLREQIAKLRQQSQQVLRNNHAATAVIVRPYNVNNNN